MRTVAAENNKAVEFQLVVILLHRRNLVNARLVIDNAHELERLARCAEDSAAACEKTRELGR